MASQFMLNPIEAKTKGAVKALRRSGFVPVSIQHKGMPTEHYQLEAKALDDFIKRYGEASFIDLVTDGKTHQRAIVRGVQRDPLSQKLLQVTFQQVRHDDKVKTRIPLVFIGEPDAARLGDAIVQHALDALEIECGANDLPSHIDVDISGLELGHPLRVSDLPEHPNFRIIAPPDTTLASLTVIQAGREEIEAEAAEEAAAAAAAEPAEAEE